MAAKKENAPVIKPMNKKELMEELRIKSYPCLRRFLLRIGIDWQRGYQIFTTREVGLIFNAYDHQPE